MHEVMIIGGGVAGLAAANRLCDLGYSPLLLEASSYPIHKVCGEFFSPESLSLLNEWKVTDGVAIHKAHFHLKNKTLSFSLPKSAYSLSHLKFDPYLVQRAREKGAQIKENAPVSHIEWGPSFKVYLKDGDSFQSKFLMVASGRFNPLNKKLKTPQYIGFKAHFEGDSDLNCLNMFVYPQGYVGVSPIEDGKVNIAGILRQDQSLEVFLNEALNQKLASMKMIHSKWMTTPIFQFGFHNIPKWNNAFFIGDAFCSIPPVSGLGMTLALHSGWLAAECVIAGGSKRYNAELKKSLKGSMRWSKCIHSNLNLFGNVLSYFPLAKYFFYQLTRPVF